MKNKFHLYIVILTLGFFLMPSMMYACGTTSEKGCCKKEVSAKSEKNECCKNKSSNDKNNSCGGKCGHANCTSSTTNFSVISFYEIEFINNNFDFSSNKSKFHHSETYISSGFSSVWLPPKIK